jgi:hypothetical protein
LSGFLAHRFTYSPLKILKLRPIFSRCTVIPPVAENYPEGFQGVANMGSYGLLGAGETALFSIREFDGEGKAWEALAQTLKPWTLK